MPAITSSAVRTQLRGFTVAPRLLRASLARRAAALTALLVGLLALTLRAAPVLAGETPSVGHPAPALVARQFDGQIVDLAAQRGHVVVLNFWASWCSPCREEMPQLDALAREFHDQGLVVMGLSADDRHDRADALKAARGLGYLLGMLSEASRNDFGVPHALPLTYVIDADGAIVAVLRANQGQASGVSLRAAVRAALAGSTHAGASI